MCGINGIFAHHYAANPVDRAELARTRDYMAARGPDGMGEWIADDGRIGFGHRRLSIIDLTEAGGQPMVSIDGKIVVTFNGEIYNHRELRRGLEAKGYSFRSSSDTEVLSHLYAEKGEAMVHDLRGMFAFAIWDGRQRRLFMARDPYGIKPLYTANDGRAFRFASQVKALLASGEIASEIEPAGVVGFHLFGNVPEPFTLYRGIRALPAGHFQWIDWAGPGEPRAYANLAAVLANGARIAKPASDFKGRLRAGVLDSVRAHLVADVEVGVFLSAGIDSGALLGLVRDAGLEKVRAITVGFEEFAGTPEDEVPLAMQVAARYGAAHIVRRVSEDEFEADLPRILEAMDQPSIDGVNTWFVAKAACEAGLKVAISGLGGDELLGGYPSFRDIPRWHRRFGLFASVPGLGRAARLLAQVALPGFAREHPKALGMLQYTGSWAGTYLLRRGIFLPDELSALLDHDVLREGLRRLRPLSAIAAQMSPDPGSAAGRVCLLESANYMRNQLLRDTDWAGMAHGLEIRVPLVDWHLTSFLAPDIPSLAPGAGKTALAFAPSHALPDAVRLRAKTGFSVPTGDWVALQRQSHAVAKPKPRSKGQASRLWLREVYGAIAPSRAGQPMQSH